MRSSVLLLAGLAAGPASAAEPTAVLSSGSAHYRQALEGFIEAWGSTGPVVGAGRALPADARAFAAIGSEAAARAWPQDAVVVAVMAPSVADDPADGVTRVSLLADPEVIVARMRALVPGLQVARVFWASASARGDSEELIAAGERHGLVFLSERVDPPSRLPEHLRSLTGKAGALWLMPDPALVNEKNFSVLREYAAAERIPLLAPTEGLAERGATATIAASFRDMGRAAAASLRARLAGGAAPEVSYSKRVSVTVNGPAARAAGLSLGSADKVLP